MIGNVASKASRFHHPGNCSGTRRVLDIRASAACVDWARKWLSASSPLWRGSANRSGVTAAVKALPLTAGDTAADLGFGGGVGLGLLLRHVGTSGHVDGVDLSATMLSHAARRFRGDIATGRLRLHAASMTELPLTTGSVDGAITLNGNTCFKSLRKKK